MTCCFESETPGSATSEKPLPSLVEIYKVGIGPSSSHTIGPMKAASAFRENCKPFLARVARLRATAYGSLAWTGKGHATDKAMILGLAGQVADSIDPDAAELLFLRLVETKEMTLPDGRQIAFDPEKDVVFDLDTTFSHHPNAMQFEAFDEQGGLLLSERWFSIGGGFVEREGEKADASGSSIILPYPFATADALLACGQRNGLTIAEMALANEDVRRPREETYACIERYSNVMQACIARGLRMEGELAGGLHLRRRAKELYAKAFSTEGPKGAMLGQHLDAVAAFAIAVGEENASGGRVVTAPTNGAAGVVPAVLRYYLDFCPGASTEGVRTFFLASAAIGAIIKRNASISGAEVGCQGEIGSASSMAAAGLAAAMGASNEQVENAAEIALEHHLGLTCDPVKGLVQIPCIERNAFGAVKAIMSASLAMMGDGTHQVGLDQVIETMRQTGLDMSSKYKETSLGGLAFTSRGFPSKT